MVGLTVPAARSAAREAGLVLCPPDRDGPGLAGLLWPHEAEHVVTGQSPVGGALLRQHDSVVVTYARVDADGRAGVREPRRPLPGPGSAGAALPLDTPCWPSRPAPA